MSFQYKNNSTLPVVPVLQIVGYKNSGKTTLACNLIAALTAEGLRVGSAKHDAHQFRLDDHETDSEKHLSHGAIETVLTSSEATRIMRKSPISLDDIAHQLVGKVDILIAEGFKSARYPKIALIHNAIEIEELCDQAVDIRLWVSWEEPMDQLLIPVTPILSIKDQAEVLKEAIFLAQSLL